MMIVYVMGLFVSVLFCGLSLDIGLLELQRTQMQTAADAAAIAEEMHFERQTNIDNSDGSDGFAAATTLGYTNGVNNTTVTFTNGLYVPVGGGDYAGHYDIVQMTITRQVHTLFMGLLNSGVATVSVVGIASPPPCDYFLGTKSLTPLTVMLANTAATAQIYAKCPAYIGGGLWVPPGAWWQHFQTYLTGSSAYSTLLGRVKSGTTFNTPVRTDPLAAIAQPAVGACNHANFTSLNTTITLSPGIYCGSVNLGVVTPGMTFVNANVTLNPGLYIISGGANWLNSTVTGNGVTLFFTKVAGTTSYGRIVTNVGDNLTLNALMGATLGSQAGGTGALAEVLFFLDRAWVNTTLQDFDLEGNANFSGITYMPDTGLAMQNGSSQCTGYCALITDNFYLANYTLHQYGTDYTLAPGLNPMRSNSVLVQ